VPALRDQPKEAAQQPPEEAAGREQLRETRLARLLAAAHPPVSSRNTDASTTQLASPSASSDSADTPVPTALANGFSAARLACKPAVVSAMASEASTTTLAWPSEK